MTAIISECGKYRYYLSREVRDVFGQKISDRVMTFIMLNPSTANHEINDPTIRRCLGFAERQGCGELQVVNLFAARSPDPKILREASDPVGPKNYEYVEKAIRNAENFYDRNQDGIVVCAWGTQGSYMDQDLTVLGWLDNMDMRPLCLGVTKEGHPRHPLYVPKTEPLIRFHGRKL